MTVAITGMNREQGEERDFVLAMAGAGRLPVEETQKPFRQAEDSEVPGTKPVGWWK